MGNTWIIKGRLTEEERSKVRTKLKNMLNQVYTIEESNKKLLDEIKKNNDSNGKTTGVAG